MTIRAKYYRTRSKGEPVEYEKFHHKETERIQRIAEAASVPFIETMKIIHPFEGILNGQGTQ